MPENKKKAFQANLRNAERTPIQINRGMDLPGTEVYGGYNPSQGIIHLDVPRGFNSPIDMSDALKHEEVHQSLHGLYPSPDQYKAIFHTVPPQYESYIPKDLSDRLNPSPTNLWHWYSGSRAGSAVNELPAYMSIYNPNQWSGQGTGTEVNQPIRNQYMTDLYEWLNTIGQAKKAQFLQHLISGREQAQRIYPSQNVGNIQP